MQIAPFEAEIENLYGRLAASPIRTLVITSALAKEGVSCTAQALTHRLLLAGHSALLVDMNIFSPSLNSLTEEPTHATQRTAALAQPSMVTTEDTQLILQGVSARNDKALMALLRQPKFFSEQIDQWKESFDYIIIDAPPLFGPESDSVPADHIASLCDACALVVLSCSTPDREIVKAVNKLKAKGATLLGCILNDQYNPPIKDELLREINRLPRFLQPIRRILAKLITNSDFLSIEV